MARTKEQNRERMPVTAALVDDIREHFGMPAYMKLTENGITIEWLNPDYIRRGNGTLEYVGPPLT